MNGEARLRAWATLALNGLPQRALYDLLRSFGDPEAIVAASRRAWSEVVPAPVVAKLAAGPDPARLEHTLAWLATPGHRLLAWDDPDYPRALLDIGDAPPVLFLLGRGELLNRTSIAIVGSRHATAQGCDDARNFALALADAGVTVVSGLALGIDAAAHEGALAAKADGSGSTIAIVGTGLDRVYPGRHRALAHRIAEHGALVSEFPPGTPPLKGNFPRRNRLISAIARGVLVVEASLQSGSLITARLAGEQGRDVFALPGSIHSPLARGCHKLIREGAKLTETVQDILGELGLAEAPSPAAATSAPADPALAAVWKALAGAPAGLDRLVERTGMTAHAVAASLTALELDARAAPLPGGVWQRRG